MKLDRNINPDGLGKYAVISLRDKPEIQEVVMGEVDGAWISADDFDDGSPGSDGEWFLLRLKDAGAAAALEAYARFYDDHDPEWADECRKLAERARNHPNRKLAD